MNIFSTIIVIFHNNILKSIERACFPRLDFDQILIEFKSWPCIHGEDEFPLLINGKKIVLFQILFDPIKLSDASFKLLMVFRQIDDGI